MTEPSQGLQATTTVVSTVHGIIERCVLVRLHVYRVHMSRAMMERLRGELQCTAESWITELFGVPVVVDATTPGVTVEVIA